MAFMFQSAYDPRPEDPNDETVDQGGASFTDWLKAGASGVAAMAPQAASALQASAANAGMPNAAEVFRGLGLMGDAAVDAINSSKTAGGRRAEAAAAMPEPGQAGLLEHPLDSFMMKTMGMGGQMAALAAVPESLAAQVLLGGGIGVGAAGQAALSKARAMPDEKLRQESPLYAHLREDLGMDETRARSELDSQLFDGREVLKQAFIGAMANGAMSRVLKGSEGVSGFGKGAAVGAGEFAAASGAQAAATDYAGQNADVVAGMQPDIDWHRTLAAGLNAGIEGVIPGAALGGWHGMHSRAKAAEAPRVEAAPELAPDATQAAATAPDPAQARTTVSPEQIANDALASAVQQAEAARAANTRVQTNTPAAPAPEAPVVSETPPDQLAQAQAAQAANDRVQAAQLAPAPEAPAAPQPVDMQAVRDAYRAQSIDLMPTAAGKLAEGFNATPDPQAAFQDHLDKTFARKPAVPEAPGNATTPAEPGGGSVPETAATLKEQRQALAAGKRTAIFYPEGTKTGPPPKGMKGVAIEGRGRVHFDPAKIDADGVRAAFAEGRENELLGMGPVTKAEAIERAQAGETPVAVTERTPDGTEVKAAAGTDQTAEAQRQALEAAKAKPENTVQVEAPEKVVAGRLAKSKDELLDPNRHQVTPEDEARIQQIAEAKAAQERVRQDAAARGMGEEDERITGEDKRSHAEKAKEARDAIEAQQVFDAHPPVAAEHTNIEREPGRVLLRNRLKAMLDDAKARNIKVPEYMTKGTSDHVAFLVLAKKLYKRLKNGEVSKHEIANFKGDEILARAGDFAEMRARYKIEGDIGSKQSDVLEELHEGARPGDERIEEERAGREQGEVDERTAVEDHTATEDEPPGLRRAREATERVKTARQAPREEEPGPKVFGARDRAGTFTAQKKRVVRRPDGSIVAHEDLDAGHYADELASLLDEHDRSEARIPAYNGTVRPLETHTVAGALDAVLRHGQPRYKVGALLRGPLVKRLQELAAKTPVHFVTPEDMLNTLQGTPLEGRTGVRGYYEPGRGHIIIRSDLRGADLHHTLIHESVHAALDAELANRPGLRQQVRGLMEAITRLDRGEDSLDLHKWDGQRGEYAWENEKEFLAEVLSNEALQNKLAQVQLPATLAKELGLHSFRKYSMWQGFVSAVRNILKLKNSEYTALEAALRVSHDAMGLPSDMHGWERNVEREVERVMSGDLSSVRPGDDRISFMRVHDEITTPSEEYVRDPAVAAGRNVLAPLRDAATAAVDALRSPDIPPASRGLLYKLTTNDQLRQMKERLFGEANERNPLRRFTDVVERVGAAARHYSQAGDAVARELYAAKRKYEGDKGWNQFVKLAHDATHIGVAADQGLDGPGNTHLKLSKENEARLVAGKDVEDLGAMAAWQARTQHAAINAAFNKLPPELQKLYRRTRQFYVDRQNQMSRGLLANIMREDGIEDAALLDRIHRDTATEDDYAPFSEDVQKALKNATELKKLKGDYFPQMRRGKYVVTGKHVVDLPAGAREVADGTYEFKSRKEAFQFVRAQKDLRVLGVNSVYYEPTTGARTTKAEGLSQAGSAEQRYQVRLQRQHMEMFDSVREAEARAADLRKAGLEDVSPVQLRKNNVGMDLSLTSPQVQALVAKIKASKSMTEAQKAALTEQMLEATVQMRPGVRVEHRALPRKYVLGASNDLIHNTVDYTGSTSSYLARMDHAKPMDAAFDAMKERAFDGRNFDKDTLERQEVFQEFENRVYGSGRQDYGSPMSPVMRHLMTVSFIKRMASPAHLLLHMTHPTMISVPVLGARHGVVASYKEIYRAYRDMGGFVSGLGEGVQAMARMAKNFDTKPMNYIDYFASKVAKSADGAQLSQMLRELAETGHIHPEAGLEIHRMLPGEGIASRALDRVDGTFRELTNATESINRVAEAVAAYRLEMQRNGGNHDQAVRYTKDTLANSQGLYSTTNAAPLFRNKALRPFLQFRQFPQMMYHLLARNLYQAFKGETPEVRKQAAKQFAYVVGTHAAMAGALGLPLEVPKIAVTLAYALGVTSTNWADIEHKGMELATDHLGETAGHILMHGFSRALGPFSPDVHHRLGLNSLLTFGAPDSSKPDDTMNYLLNTLAGAPGSVGLDFLRGSQALRNGEYMKAFEYMSPVKALTDIAKTARLGIEGKPSKQGGGMSPLSAPEMIMQGIGFTPGRVSDYGEARAMARREAMQTRDQQSTLIQQWVKASPAEKHDAFKQVQAYNAGKPKEEQITMQQLTSAAKRKSSGGETILGQKVTKRNRRQLEELERVYGVR